MMHRRMVSVPAALAIFGGGLALAGPTSPASAAVSVATGFTDAEVATVNSPTAVEALPDGRVVVLDQSGKVRIYQPGVGLFPTPALTLSLGSCGSGEMGFLGFTTDNAFATNGYVYLYATRPLSNGKCVNRVSRFVMAGNTIDPATETVLLDNIPGNATPLDSAGNHNGGDIEVGQDGYLYVSVGDSGSDPRGGSGSAGGNDAAQDLSILSGKILRIGTDGSIPADNPFVAAGSVRCQSSGIDAALSSKCQEIFSYGLRNPYRFAFDPNEGATRFFINDVGQGTREEVDEGIKGANYGWNIREGQCAQGQSPPCPVAPAGLTDPITDYDRSAGCTYITGGAFVPNGVWPAAYDGAYLFADGGCGRIFVRTRDGNVNYSLPFASGLGVLADMAFVPEGAGYSLYYTDAAAKTLHKVTYNGLAVATSVSGLRLTPTAPTRVYDTRNGIGTTKGLVRASTSRVINVRPSVQPGAAAALDPSVKAVLANVTYAGAQGAGFAQAWPTRTARPATSILNSSAGGDVVANSVVLPIAADGTIIISTSVTTDLIVDVMGYFAIPSGTGGGELVPVTPARLVDTRQPSGTVLDSGAPNGYTVVGDHIDVQVSGRLNMPTDGSVGSVAFILTALGSSAGDGFATAYPSGQARPEASNVNTSGPGDIRANLVVVPVGPGGKVSLYGFHVDHLLVDVAGYFTATTVAATGHGLFTVTPSTRIADTRGAAPLGFGPLGANGTATLDVSPPVPVGAISIVQNLTVAGTGGWGYVQATPSGASGQVSNLNYTGAGQTRAALSMTQLKAGEVVRYYSFAATQLIVDAYGYFV